MKRLQARTLGLILGWSLVGLGLRLLQLGAKPIWADEWTTFVFSLGHSFRTLPVNQLLSLDELLQPVTLDGASAQAGIQALMNESTHPPLYFWLSHYWIQFWQQPGELVSAAVGRSLSVLFGVVTIPITYWIAHSCNLSRRTAVLATALTAVSPLGLYLAQDARHYTLTLIWCLLSLGCVLRAWQAIQLKRPLPPHLVGGWILSNALGLASHYFYGLFLAAQGLAFAGLALQKRWLARSLGQEAKSFPSEVSAAWWKVAIAALGSGFTLIPWSFFLQRSAQSNLTSWLEQDLSGLALLDPVVRLFTWFLSMVILLPVEQVPIIVAIAFGLILLASLGWLTPRLWQSFKQQLKLSNPSKQPQSSKEQIIQATLQALCALLCAELVLFFLIIYGSGRDISLSPRYVFSMLPLVSLAIAILLNHRWPKHRLISLALLGLGVLGSLTIAYDFAYQKADRPDLFVQGIHQYYEDAQAQAGETWPGDPLSETAPRSLVFATIQKTHSETAKLMGVAQEWQVQSKANLDTSALTQPDLQEPQLMLLKRNPYTRSATRGLRDVIDPLPRPADVWIINFSAHINFRDLGCSVERVTKVRSPGYSAHRFVCN